MKITKGKTSIIVSHRVSCVRHADKIIVLENGKEEDAKKIFDKYEYKVTT